MSDLLRAWNHLAAPEAEASILPCNGSHAWSEAMAHARPFATPEALFRTADHVWRSLDLPAWQQAFSSHPRIGATHGPTATPQSLRWSQGEQSAAHAGAQTQQALAEANRLYEAKFGRIFLVCATGKSATEILTLLQRRLGNDPQRELLEAAEQQRRITQLRLRKWLALPAASCDSV